MDAGDPIAPAPSGDGQGTHRADVCVLEHDAQLRALANPERAGILRLLIERAGTAAHVADWVSGTRGRVHYHIKALERAGLVRIVSRVERGGVIEKYYRAVARNFVLAQGIGEAPDLTGEVTEHLAIKMLDWRRENVLAIDQHRIAERIVADCLATGTGDLVLVAADFAHGTIVEVLHDAVVARGAQCVVHYRSAAGPAFVAEWLPRLRSVIVLEEPVAHLAGELSVPPDGDEAATDAFFSRIAAEASRLGHASHPGDPFPTELRRTLLEAGVRVIYFGYPTTGRARLLGVDPAVLHDACWTALDVDYRELATACERAKMRLERGDEIHVRSAGGTDLRFRIGGREVFVDDGIISDWEIARGRGFNHLPAGKLIVAPLETTANGTVHAHLAEYLGVRMEGVRLTFRDGRVVTATADTNERLLRRVLAAGRGDHDRIGELALGMNPRIANPIGYTVWDSKALGSIYLGLGRNESIGGANVTEFGWGIPVYAPTVHLDGEVILEGGSFRA